MTYQLETLIEVKILLLLGKVKVIQLEPRTLQPKMFQVALNSPFPKPINLQH